MWTKTLIFKKLFFYTKEFSIAPVTLYHVKLCMSLEERVSFTNGKSGFSKAFIEERYT